MAQRPELSATPRASGRKALLTALRREGKIPGVLYGRGDPAPIAMDARQVREFLRHHAASALIDLEVDGDRTTAIFKQVDHDPVTGQVSHFDLQRIALTDTITAHVPLVFSGVEEVEREGGVLTYQTSELTVHCRADHLPETIPVDVSSLRVGDLLRVENLTIPEGVQVTQGADQVVVTCTSGAAEVEEEEEEEVAPAPGAEAPAPEAREGE